MYQHRLITAGVSTSNLMAARGYAWWLIVPSTMASRHTAHLGNVAVNVMRSEIVHARVKHQPCAPTNGRGRVGRCATALGRGC